VRNQAVTMAAFLLHLRVSLVNENSIEWEMQIE